jgi:uncharacterized protein YcgI (DUF1989 family)
MIWRAPPMSALAWPLAAGHMLKVTDIEGGQSGDVFAVAADDVSDGLSNGHIFDYSGTIRLSAGSVLYSRKSANLVNFARPCPRSCPGRNMRLPAQRGSARARTASVTT